ncbi:MAG: hypothetical protein MN733_35425 [Nitrososphaera sp.]|nr:hypothetical protein [Nitrososphaera sp.]
MAIVVRPLPLFVVVFFLLAASACTQRPQTAASFVSADATANPSLISTVQADQYWRDAQATTQAQQATLQANYQNVQATAEAAGMTSTAVLVQATATTQAQQTQDALMLILTVDAATQQAQATATEQGKRASEATATAGAVATAQSFQATREALAIRQAEATARREAIVTAALYTFLILSGLLIVGLGAWFFMQVIPTLVSKAGVVTYGQHGNPLLLNARGGRTVVTNPLTMVQPSVIIDGDTVTMPELTPYDVQALMAGGSLRLLMEQARNAPGHAPQLPTETVDHKQFGPWKKETTVRNIAGRVPAPIINLPQSVATGEIGPGLPADAPWGALDSWQGDGLPLGLGSNGIILVNPETSPHLLLAGTSGSGKTRYGLRPLIAAALAGGWQVAVFDRSGLDFLPFYEWPNAYLVLLDDPGHSINYLMALYEEVQQRQAVLREAGLSTWSMLANARRILAVIDEFSNLADSLPGREREELWRWARMIAAEGRKAGIHLALALQDPTHKSLDLRIRRNCTPLTFRVRDKAASHVVLGAGGAESLAPRHFLAVIGDLVEGVAFAPSDVEIHEFLAQRQVEVLPYPAWLQSVL